MARNFPRDSGVLGNFPSLIPWVRSGNFVWRAQGGPGYSAGVPNWARSLAWVIGWPFGVRGFQGEGRGPLLGWGPGKGERARGRLWIWELRGFWNSGSGEGAPGFQGDQGKGRPGVFNWTPGLGFHRYLLTRGTDLLGVWTPLVERSWVRERPPGKIWRTPFYRKGVHSPGS